MKIHLINKMNLQFKSLNIYLFNCNTVLLLLLLISIFSILRIDAQRNNRPNIRNQIECLVDSRFYRNPKRAVHKMWTYNECAKYYLCLEGEVFNFTCSDGLLFDVMRQICDFKQNVDNCDVTSEIPVPKPLLNNVHCEETTDLACADGTCLPNEFFCDGSIDCPDASDEGWCETNSDLNAADRCNLHRCRLPQCFCSKDGTQIPGYLNASKVPQMILLTFSGPVNMENWESLSKILYKYNKRNPNGCPIKATFFVSHPFTNYRQIQKLWNDGHEIAVHSITERKPETWWSVNATIEDWFDEMVGQANILHRFANVRLEEIRGIRAPYLRVGWNRQFLMMKEFGFVYDSTIVAPLLNPPLWPYTLDYKIPHICIDAQQMCPTRSYGGIWEMIINQLEVGESVCTTLDNCPMNLNTDDIYRLLTHNFKRHYLTNRAPFGIYVDSKWFQKKENLNAFLKFLNDLDKLKDVYFVTNQQAIQWMHHPTPSHRLHQFESWGCKSKRLESHELVCHIPNNCKLQSRILLQERLLHTCSKCPAQYPWVRNEFGLD